MFCRYVCNFAVGLIIASSVLGAAEFWDKADPSTWSEKDCSKLLNDSPWAWTRTYTKEQIIASIKAQALGIDIFMRTNTADGAVAAATADLANVPERFGVGVIWRSEPIQDAERRLLSLSGKGQEPQGKGLGGFELVMVAPASLVDPVTVEGLNVDVGSERRLC